MPSFIRTPAATAPGRDQPLLSRAGQPRLEHAGRAAVPGLSSGCPEMSATMIWPGDRCTYLPSISDPHEPDGIAMTSTQAVWLQAALAASTAPWNLVTMHHPPFSSGAARLDPGLAMAVRRLGRDGRVGRARSPLRAHPARRHRLLRGRLRRPAVYPAGPALSRARSREPGDLQCQARRHAHRGQPDADHVPIRQRHGRGDRYLHH